MKANQQVENKVMTAMVGKFSQAAGVRKPLAVQNGSGPISQVFF